MVGTAAAGVKVKIPGHAERARHFHGTLAARFS